MSKNHHAEQKGAYVRAMRLSLRRRPFLRSTELYLTREEANDRVRLRLERGSSSQAD